MRTHLGLALGPLALLTRGTGVLQITAMAGSCSVCLCLQGIRVKYGH